MFMIEGSPGAAGLAAFVFCAHGMLHDLRKENRRGGVQHGRVSGQLAFVGKREDVAFWNISLCEEGLFRAWPWSLFQTRCFLQPTNVHTYTHT